MSDSIYTKTKHKILDTRADKKQEADQLDKEATQMEIAGDKVGAAKLREAAAQINAGLTASAPIDQEGVGITETGEEIDQTLPPAKPNSNVGKPGYTASGGLKL